MEEISGARNFPKRQFVRKKEGTPYPPENHLISPQSAVPKREIAKQACGKHTTHLKAPLPLQLFHRILDIFPFMQRNMFPPIRTAMVCMLMPRHHAASRHPRQQGRKSRKSHIVLCKIYLSQSRLSPFFPQR
jgi:hypothetical protein